MSRATQVQRLFYETLTESQYWPAEKMREHQRTHLARLLRHARNEVPFYRGRLDPLFTRSGDIDWDKWREIQILTRQDLLTHRDAMQSEHLAEGHGKVHHSVSSGSAGVPIRVSHSSYSGFASAAAVFRAHHWHGLDWSRDLLLVMGDDPSTGTLPDGERGPPWGPSWMPEVTGLSRRLNLLVNSGDILRFIQERGITYLSCRPKTAQALALEAMRLGLSVRLDVILGFGTSVLPDEEEDCRLAFGARIFAPYSSSEAQIMAHRCPTGDHYHINEETVLVEILDEEGNSSAPGEIGRVIVTPIFNFAQPLIRYEQGDLAIAGERCASGMTLGVVERVVGRTSDLFRFPDGSTVAPRVPSTFRSVLGAQFWQIAQVAPLAMEVRYVPKESATADETAAAQIVRQITHRDVIVTFRPVHDIVRARTGKYAEYVCELPL
ncbi:MAG: phenylacetate--CoA ligase family protein [Devosia nanyangense]|uniref:Phenylacetate--CoA ligase family protein n=1 Tax=Devosia nanyangense TaxID=1228055 RepID=A0A933NXV8_9HYPH|nr:phenylacetate--CoA ligase family protein [Devosia nanyangense]